MSYRSLESENPGWALWQLKPKMTGQRPCRTQMYVKVGSSESTDARIVSGASSWVQIGCFRGSLSKKSVSESGSQVFSSATETWQSFEERIEDMNPVGVTPDVCRGRILRVYRQADRF